MFLPGTILRRGGWLIEEGEGVMSARYKEMNRQMKGEGEEREGERVITKEDSSRALPTKESLSVKTPPRGCCLPLLILHTNIL